MTELPPRITGPQVWRGAEFDRIDWAFRLNDRDRDEIDGALAAVKRSGIALRDIRREHFVLPTLGPRLVAESDAVEGGRGFALIKGIPVARYDEDDNGIIAWGLCAHFGVGLPQSRQGDYINPIIDLTDIKSTTHAKLQHIVARGELRVSHHGGRRYWHTDTADIVALLCMRVAKSGGTSRLASSMMVHNVLREEFPDELAALYDGFYYHNLPDDTGGPATLSKSKVPVFKEYNGAPGCYFIPEPVERAIAREGIRYSPAAEAARFRIEEIADRPGMALRMTLEPGDLQIINNRVLLHAREDYEDWPEIERRRLLLRLWLRVPGRTTAPEMRVHSQFEAAVSY